MKSHAKRGLRGMPAAEGQISLPVQGVLHGLWRAGELPST